MTSPGDPALLEVGRIDRAHGVSGEVVVRLVTNDLARVEPGSTLLLGDRAPLTVARARPHKERWIVAFEEIADRGTAEAVAGEVLYGEAARGDLDSYWVHDLIGSQIVDAQGRVHGEVVEVLANPASDVLVVSSGALVPLRFAEWEGPGRLLVDGPAGLLDG